MSARHTYPIIVTLYWCETDHEEQVILSILTLSHKAENTAFIVVGIHPLKSCPGRILLVQAWILTVQMKQCLYPILHMFVFRIIQQEPVQFALLAPLTREFLSHKQQLLAGMSHHECVTRHKVFKLIPFKSRHLVEHGAFQMYDLIMG